MGALMAASRVLVGISAQSIAAVEDVVDLVHIRALVVIATCGSVSLSELSQSTNIHLTRASRLCVRLESKGLIVRTQDPVDRRQLILTLTSAGRKLVHEVMDRRRQAIEQLLVQIRQDMDAQELFELTAVLRAFAAAAGEPAHADLWSMGWAAPEVVQQGEASGC